MSKADTDRQAEKEHHPTRHIVSFKGSESVNCTPCMDQVTESRDNLPGV